MNRSEAGKLGFLKSKETMEQKHKVFVDSYNQNPKKCAYCSVTIPFDKRYNDYCSRSCAVTVNNKRKSMPHPCSFCGEEIKKRTDRMYCSQDCNRKAKWKEFKDDCKKTGVISLNDTSSDRKRAKRFLAEERGRACEICSFKEWMGEPIPLILDHIDGNATNNSIVNLRLVCGNCNMQLPTFAGRNKGNGRAWRRERYKQQNTNVERHE